MRRHERWVMAQVKREGFIRHPITPSPSISKAIERLEDAGKLRWHNDVKGQPFGAYVATQKGKP